MYFNRKYVYNYPKLRWKIVVCVLIASDETLISYFSSFWTQCIDSSTKNRWNCTYMTSVFSILHISYRLKCYEISKMLRLLGVRCNTKLQDSGDWAISISKLTIIGSDNGLLWPGQRQAIIWTSAGILLVRTLGTTSVKCYTAAIASTWQPVREPINGVTGTWLSCFATCDWLRALVHLHCDVIITTPTTKTWWSCRSLGVDLPCLQKKIYHQNTM